MFKIKCKDPDQTKPMWEGQADRPKAAGCCAVSGARLSPGQPCLPSPPRTPGDVGVPTINITGTCALDPDFHALVGMPSPWECSLHLPDVNHQCKRQCGHFWGDGEMGSNRPIRLGDLADRSVIGQQNKQKIGAQAERRWNPAGRRCFGKSGFIVGGAGSGRAGFGADSPGTQAGGHLPSAIRRPSLMYKRDAFSRPMTVCDASLAANRQKERRERDIEDKVKIGVESSPQLCVAMFSILTARACSRRKHSALLS